MQTHQDAHGEARAAKYRSMFESTLQPIVLIGPQGSVRFNPAAAALFRSADPSAGALLNQILPARQPDGSDSRLEMAWRAQTAREGWPQAFEVRLRCFDGVLFDSHASLARAEWEAPQTVQLTVSPLGESVDRAAARPTRLTEQAELTELAERSRTQEAVARLAGGVAHDFNNLLTAIIGNAQLLESRQLAADDRHAVREIDQAAERAARIVYKLLTFSGRRQRVMKRVDLNALVEGMRGRLQDLMGRGTRVALRLDPSAAYVSADPAHLEEAILAMALNAREAMPSGGSLDVEASTSAERVVLSVSDTGCGMSPAACSRAFEPYFASRAGVVGAGLELATVFGIVHQSGGQVEAHARPGGGTMITISLPRA